MKVSDVMTRAVVSVTPETSILEMARLMDERRISGMPVINAQGKLVGMVTDSDCLRRAETGTQRKRSRWSAFLAGPEQQATDYMRANGRKVGEIMTDHAVTITENAGLEEAIHLLEKHQIHRVPVVTDGKVVGILSRSNLVQAMAGLLRTAPAVSVSDEAIKLKIENEFDKISWATREFVNVTVKDGVVDLWGSYTAYRQDEAAVVAAENVPGVKQVINHLAWVDPMSGLVVYEPKAA